MDILNKCKRLNLDLKNCRHDRRQTSPPGNFSFVEITPTMRGH